jgi:hypothetical protein
VEDEGWRVRKDGSRFWASVVMTAFYDESDQIRGFAKVTRDITERRLLGEQLRQSAAETRGPTPNSSSSRMWLRTICKNRCAWWSATPNYSVDVIGGMRLGRPLCTCIRLTPICEVHSSQRLAVDGKRTPHHEHPTDGQDRRTEEQRGRKTVGEKAPE